MKKKINTLAFIKRQAKISKKELNITHTQALELIAKKNGYSNWKHCLRELSKEPVKKIVLPEEKLKLSFTDWLMKHKKRDSPLGDLASDAQRDKTWPLYNTILDYQNYLMFKGASLSALDTLKKAWKSYMAYIRRKNLLIPKSPNTIMEEVIIRDKQKYLDENYPFENKLNLADKRHCLHCGSVISVGDYKVFRREWEEFICCPNAPDCDGTIIDWVDKN